MQKRLILVLLAVLALSIAAVTAQEDPLADIDPTGVTLTYWHEWNGTQTEGINEVIRLFEENNEFGITVEVQELGSGGSIVEAINAGITSGDLPNIAGNGFANTAMGYALEENLLVTLSQYAESPTWGFTEEELAAFNADSLAINSPAIPDSMFDGQLLAWPTGISARVLSVNIDMINEMNELGAIDFADRAPQTLEEFRAVACAGEDLENLRGEGPDVRGFPIGLSQDELASFVYNQGGTLFDAEANRYDFTNDTVVEIMQFMRDLANDGCAYLPEENFPDSGVMALGLTPMAGGSTAGLPFILSGIADSGSGIENFVQTTYPWTEGNRGILPFLRGVMVFEGTPEENLAAWLFIKFWATNIEAQVAWTNGAVYQPIYNPTVPALSTDVLEDQFFEVTDLVFTEGVSLIQLPVHPRNRDIGSALVAALTEAVTGDADIMELLEAAEEEANAIYEEDLANFEG